MTAPAQAKENETLQRLEQALLPVSMRLHSFGHPRRVLQAVLSDLLGTGRLNAVRLDLYADASGKDDWDSKDKPWYVIAVAAVRGDDAWRSWVERFNAEYGGDFHLGNRTWYEAHGGEASRPNHVRRLVELRPWQFAKVLIAHRDAVRRTIDSMQSTPMPPEVGAPLLWATQVSAFATYLRESWRLVVSPQAGKQVIRKVVCDHWGIEAMHAYGANLMDFYGVVTPTFQAATCPGLGIVDGLAWGFRAALMYPNDRVLPWMDQEPLDSRLQVSVLTTSPKPTTCTTMAQVRQLMRLA